jgi:hypothetical protein
MKLGGGDELSNDLLKSVFEPQALELRFQARGVGLPFEDGSIKSGENPLRRERFPPKKWRRAIGTVACTPET